MTNIIYPAWGNGSESGDCSPCNAEKDTLKTGYPIADFQAHFDRATTPLEQVHLFNGNRVDQESITLKAAKKRVFGAGIDSLNRIEEILRLLNRISGGDPERINFFKETWATVDDDYHYGGTILFALENSGISEDFRSYLKPQETDWLSTLGKEFTVYRGCTENRIDGIRWRTDYDVARSNAVDLRGIFNSNPVVVSARCQTVDIQFAVNDCGETEIILDPTWLEDIWVEPIATH